MKKKGSSKSLVFVFVILVIILIMVSFFIGKNIGKRKAIELSNNINNPSSESNVQEQNEGQNQENPPGPPVNNPESNLQESEFVNCLKNVAAEKIPTSLKLFKSGNQITYAGKPGKFVGTVQVDLNNNERNLPSSGIRGSYVNPINYYAESGQFVRITVTISKFNKQEDYNSILNDLMTLNNKGSVIKSDIKDSKLYMIDDSNKTYIGNKWYSAPGDQQYLQFNFEGFNSEDSRLLIDQFIDTIC